MPTQIEKRYYTSEEYLGLEEVADYKSEYHDRGKNSVTIAQFLNFENIF
jgi:hypothetical protein